MDFDKLMDMVKEDLKKSGLWEKMQTGPSLEEALALDTLEGFDRHFGDKGKRAQMLLNARGYLQRELSSDDPERHAKAQRTLRSIEKTVRAAYPEISGRKGGLKSTPFKAGILGGTIRILLAHGDIGPAKLFACFPSLLLDYETLDEDEDLVQGILQDGTIDQRWYFVWIDIETGRIRQNWDGDASEPRPGIKKETWRRGYLPKARRLIQNPDFSLPEWVKTGR